MSHGGFTPPPTILGAPFFFFSEDPLTVERTPNFESEPQSQVSVNHSVP